MTSEPGGFTLIVGKKDSGKVDMSDGILGDGMYMTTTPSIYAWKQGEVNVRIVVPEGEETDYSSIPDKGILGKIAHWRGFNKSADYFTRSGKIHDELYEAIKYQNGFLKDGWFQFFNKAKNTWEPVLNYRWTQEEADGIWKSISIEDGCPVALANEGYWWLRHFGGLHMLLH